MTSTRPAPSVHLPASPAAERNKHPILEALRTWLGPRGLALEIASGTGQHAVWFASALKDWIWQPTEADAGLLSVIERRVALSGVSNVRPPAALDVMAATWPSADAPFTEAFDAIFCANMLHIAPLAAGTALMQGTARHLRPGGRLITYGPYIEQGPTSPSNQAFDADLRSRNPAWGIRRLDQVVEEAARCGLVLRARQDMPAHNLLLLFEAHGPTA